MTHPFLSVVEQFCASPVPPLSYVSKTSILLVHHGGGLCQQVFPLEKYRSRLRRFVAIAMECWRLPACLSARTPQIARITYGRRVVWACPGEVSLRPSQRPV